MRIRLEQSGGFAGLHLAASVDTDDLSPDEAGEVRQLAEAADLRAVESVDARAQTHPDEQSYDLDVQPDDGAGYRVHLTDTTTPAHVRPLLNWLQRYARNQRRR